VRIATEGVAPAELSGSPISSRRGRAPGGESGANRSAQPNALICDARNSRPPPIRERRF
jgi:hypothetical protein